MKRLVVIGVVLFLACASRSFAQSANPLTANAKIQFGALSGFVVRSAEKVPEELYSFRATPEVRSMAELFGHVADAMFAMCSTAAGTKPPRTGIEKVVTSKPALIVALKEAVTGAQPVIELTPENRSLRMRSRIDPRRACTSTVFCCCCSASPSASWRCSAPSRSRA